MRIIKTEVFLPGGKTSKKGEKCLGDRDTLTKNYVKRADRFADIFNYYLFDGKQRIDPAQLREQDTAQIVLPYGKDLTEMPMQRFRDILKQAVLMTDGYCQSDQRDGGPEAGSGTMEGEKRNGRTGNVQSLERTAGGCKRRGKRRRPEGRTGGCSPYAPQTQAFPGGDPGVFSEIK